MSAVNALLFDQALWATANAATQVDIAKEAFKGNPKAAAAAERETAAALLAANERADMARVQATITSFVNVCIAQVLCSSITYVCLCVPVCVFADPFCLCTCVSVFVC